MRQLMDEVLFAFSDEGNELVMVKRQEQRAASESPQPMTAYQSESQVWVVVPQGRLDAAHTPHLETTLADLLAQGHIWLLIDMTQVTYIASRSLKALVSAWRTARDAGGEVALCGLTDRVLSVFETVGFTQVFDVYPTLDEGLAALRTREQ
jgi:anti-anti-sigma factor